MVNLITAPMKNVLAGIFLTTCFVSFSQDSDPIATDRPTQSAGATVVAPGDFLLEMGFVNEKVTEGLTNSTFLNAHLRIGIIERFELRITQNYVGTKVAGERTTGLSPLILGTKVHLLDEHKWKPQMSVLGQVTLETGSDDFNPDSPVAEIRFNFQNTISDRFAIGYNLGYMDAGFNDFLYSLVFGISIVDGLSLFAEPYGFFGDDMDQRFNAGLIYLANPKTQFDVSFGSGLSEISPDSFVAFGAAFGF